MGTKTVLIFLKNLGLGDVGQFLTGNSTSLPFWIFCCNIK